MFFKHILTAALVVIGGFQALALPMTSDDRIGRSDEYVNTPGGPRLRSQVHFVPPGARIHHDSDTAHVISSEGEIFLTTKITRQSTTSSLASRDITSGYVAYSVWSNKLGSPIKTFTTSWVVPPAPKTYNGQLLYIFNALEPSSGDAILQPVLQFGTSSAGGDKYWAIASWYLLGDDIFHSTLVPVQSGATLTGTMTLQSVNASGASTSYSYNSKFSSSPYASITVTTTEELNLVYEALEIYSVVNASDLPTGKTSMNGISLTMMDGSHPSVQWTAINDATDGFKTAVVTNSSTSGEVDLIYPS
ncbi:hypothetical protein BDQ17DRAFT_1545833 [Cyathus striatus]|nr:hypothetical protein BDQ17DRAFT_1545833 [Cyathus striatus]